MLLEKCNKNSCRIPLGVLIITKIRKFRDKSESETYSLLIWNVIEESLNGLYFLFEFFVDFIFKNL
jgi:hypothetical protein